MFFHEYFADFDGDFGVFDENDTYNFVPNKRPPFSPFFKRPGRLKGRIRYCINSTIASEIVVILNIQLKGIGLQTFTCT